MEIILGSLMVSVLSSANRNNLTSPFPIFILFLFMSCLVALARTHSPVLDRSRGSGQSCLVLDFYGFGNIQDDVSNEFIIYSFFYVEVHSFQSYSL